MRVNRSLHPGHPEEERRLKDGSLWAVYKRVFDGEDLAEELGGELVFKGDWFLLARA